MSFEAITKHLNKVVSISISYETVVRAYDYARPELARAAAKDGKRLDRGRPAIIGEDKYAQIRRLLEEDPDLTDQKIADHVGCGKSTVHRERQRPRQRGG